MGLFAGYLRWRILGMICAYDEQLAALLPLVVHRGDVHDGTPVDDNALRAAEGTLCHACGAPLTARDFVRVASKGTRHDSCP